MRHALKIAILGLVVITPTSAGIAKSKSPKLAHCDGKSRRPANMYGSVLPTVDAGSGSVAPPSEALGSVDVFPKADLPKNGARESKADSGNAPPDQVPPISAITNATSYGSC